MKIPCSKSFKWIKTNGISLVLILFVGHYFLGDLIPDRPVSLNYGADTMSRGGMAYDDTNMAIMEDEESMPMMAQSKSIRSFAGNMAESIMPPVEAAGFDPDAKDRKIIKNGNLQLEVDSTDEAKILAEKEIEMLGGLVTNGNSWENRPGVLAYSLTVRIPAESFETLIANLSTLGVKKSENFSSNDITESYNDTEAQLENLEARRVRLLKLMEFKTESLSDVLQVDREISNVQREIERHSRTQNRRDGNVAFSTLHLTINPEPKIGDFSNPEWNVEKSWKVAVNDFIHSAQGLFDKVVRAVVYTPFWLPIVAIIWGLRRRRNNKKA